MKEYIDCVCASIFIGLTYMFFGLIAFIFAFIPDINKHVSEELMESWGRKQ
jgi:hypothetical protein